MNVACSWRAHSGVVAAIILAGIAWRAEPAEKPTGTVEGVVTFRGVVPKSSIADDSGFRRELLQVDSETHGLQNVVVWLATESPARESQIRESPLAAPVMDQRDHELVPRVLAVRAGQAVKFRNSDPANHNVRTSSLVRTNEFNVFTGAGGAYTHRFAADRQRKPVSVTCDIHPWMRGWIYVFDDSLFAITDEHGRFRIKSVPPGEYKMVLQQPDIRYTEERTIVVSNAATTRVDAAVRAPDQPR